jgi:hypothetical protein
LAKDYVKKDTHFFKNGCKQMVRLPAGSTPVRLGGQAGMSRMNASVCVR